MVSARGWNQSIAKVTTLNQKVVQTQEQKKQVEEEKKEIAKTALDLNAKVKEQFEINQKITARLPPSEIRRLEIHPEILTARSPELSKQTVERLEKATRSQ